MTEKEKIKQSFKKYLPETFIDYIVELLFAEQVIFRVSVPRKTKLGDYRASRNGSPHRISVNGDLNPYSFLVTTLHEFAHLHTYLKFGQKVKSHGEEWKNEFRKLLLPVIQTGELPNDIENALINSFNNPKASSCTDVHLFRVLRKYDKKEENTILLEELDNGKFFKLNELVFQRGTLRRTRFLCKEMRTGRHYLVNRLAEVKPINIQE